MPAGFNKCRRRGGRIRTVKPKGKGSRTFLRVCFKDGKSFSGEVKKRKRR